MKKKLTLVQALKEFKLEYSVLEEVSGIPKGTIAQYTHGNRSPTEQRLKLIQKSFKIIGERMSNIRLINDKFIEGNL